MPDNKCNEYEYRLVDYCDVFGNKEDGYEVNDSRVVGNVVIREGVHVVEALRKINYLRKGVRKNQVIVEDLGEHIELYEKKSLMPICRLDLVTTL